MKINIFYFEGKKFITAYPCLIKELNNKPIAQTFKSFGKHPFRSYLFHVFFFDIDRKAFGDFWKRYFESGVDRNVFEFSAPFKKRLNRTQFSAYRSGRNFRFH